MKKLYFLTLLLLCAAGLKAQNPILEERIGRHYTAEQIIEIQNTTPYKLQVLEFYYTESFLVEDGSIKRLPTVAEWEAVDIDNYNDQRGENKDVMLYSPEIQKNIYLISMDESRQKFEGIVPAEVLHRVEPVEKIQ